MHPVLFSIGRFPIHAYGFMLALSFLVGIWLASWRAKKNNLDPNAITDVGFYLILSAIIGSRLYYVFLKWDSFKGNLPGILNPFQDGQVGIGGLVMYGGFIGAILAGILYFRIKKLPFLPYADAVAPSIGIGIFLTRIGCFLNGCCYGAQAHSPLGVIFPPDSPAGHYQQILKNTAAIVAPGTGHEHTLMEAIKLHPSQLYSSAGGLLIALIVLWAARRKFFTGFQFYLTGLLYAVMRFMVDFTRHYSGSERLGLLSHNQIVCIALFIVFGGLILKPCIFKEAPAGAASAPQQSSSNRNDGHSHGRT